MLPLWYVFTFRKGRTLMYQTLNAHAAPLTALDMSEPYGMLVTAGQDDTVKVWDLCDGEQLGQLRGHKGSSPRPIETLATDKQDL